MGSFRSLVITAMLVMLAACSTSAPVVEDGDSLAGTDSTAPDTDKTLITDKAALPDEEPDTGQSDTFDVEETEIPEESGDVTEADISESDTPVLPDEQPDTAAPDTTVVPDEQADTAAPDTALQPDEQTDTTSAADTAIEPDSAPVADEIPDTDTAAVTCTPDEVVECTYSGTPGTKGVGTCKAGTKTCNVSGSGWSSCTGEVVPVTEICANSKDDNCNGQTDENLDQDGDGWGSCSGDCCDSLTQCNNPDRVNPGAIEVAGDLIDNNCNNTTDEARTLCSTVKKFAGIAAVDLLNAMDICEVSSNGSWGIVGTPTITRADGDPVKCTYEMGCGSPLYNKSVVDKQTAVMEQFGTDASNMAIKGTTMASLSSGRARDADDPDPTNDDTFEWEAYNSNPPADFTAAHGGKLPTTKTGCKAGEYANDSVMLSVQLKVPTNAHSFSFNFRFFSQEYKLYTCSQFNDFFIAMLYSNAANIPSDKNISFDSNNNYISVNTDQFFTVCTAKTGYPCPDGTAALDGTGFGTTYIDPIGRNTYGGGTKWLSTTAPVVPGETITLKFVIWDTGDTQVDSLVLIDNFKWSAEGTGGPATFECWDINKNGVCDAASEDLSGDKLCTERDCL